MLPGSAESQRNRASRTLIVLMVALVALMPTYSALAEIYATPVVEPTPMEEVGDVPGNEVGPATPGPDVDVDDVQIQERSLVSPQSVTGRDALRGCSPNLNTIYPGQTVYFFCNLDFSAVRPGLLDLALIGQVNRVAFAQSSPGFEASITPRLDLLNLGIDLSLLRSELGFGDNNGSARIALPLANLAGIDLTNVRIDFAIRAVDVEPGDTFRTTFTACRTSALLAVLQPCNSVHGSVEVFLEVPVEEPVGGQHYTFGCVLSEDAGSASLGDTVDWMCTLGVAPGLENRRLRVDEVMTSHDGESFDGWDLLVADTTGNPIGTIPGSTGFGLSRPVISNGADPSSFQFQIRMRPVACGAGNSAPEIHVQLKLMLLQGETALGQGGNSNASAVTATADLDFVSTALVTDVSNPEDPILYNLAGPPLEASGSFKFSYTAGGCLFEPESNSWNPYSGTVSAWMTPFSWDVDENLNPSPPNRNVPMVSGSAHQGSEPPSELVVTPVALDGPLSSRSESATPLLTLESHNGSIGEGFHTIELEYTIPANTPVGIYTSTITVTTSDAP